MNLEGIAQAHATELNKAIDKIAKNLLLGLIFIGISISFVILKKK